MKEEYQWDLTELFENKEEFEKATEKMNEYLEKISSFQGRLSESSECIYQCYFLYEQLLEVFDKIYSYGMFHYHQDMGKAENIALFKKVEKIYADIEIKTSFMVPELTKLEEEKLKRYQRENGKLERYKRIIEDILEDKKHVLSEEVENALASFSEVFNGSENTYDIFTNTEFQYPNIIDEEGKEVELTDATYSRYLASKDQKVRKSAFESMYSLYQKHINTLAELYMTRVKEDTINSKLRNYHNSLEKAVRNDDASIEVYDSLVEVVHDKLSINHRYMQLKKQLLKQKELHMYDIYVNPFKEEKEEITIQEAQQTVLNALAPLGKEYIEQLRYAFSHRWIDVYAKTNKRIGAYSSGVYGVHPYVLTNFTGTLMDVSTIAHEMGHAMHSFYANKEQNILDANYTIMVAEVASTVNEILLSQYLIKKETDEIKKAALIYEQLENVRATLIHQTMFAEFEKIVHEKTENLINLTSKELSSIYYELNRKYFGEEMVVDKNIQYGWARIPHFYSCFYVYKYATGISAAIAIASKIQSQEEGIVEKYIEMLKQGRTKKSIDLLKMVGVDLENKKPYEDAFEYYEKNLTMLENLMKK